MNRSTPATGTFFVLGAAMLWGTTGTAQSFAAAGFDPAIIGACRLAIGGIALMFLALARREISRLSEWPWKQTLLAALFTAAYQLSFFAAVAKTGVAIGTVVGIGSAPIAGGILGYLFRRERPGRRWGMATILAIGGCALLGLAGRSGAVVVDMFGLVLAVGAGASYAAYTLVIKGMLEERAPNAVMAMVVCVAAIILLPTAWGRDLSWLAQPRSIAVVLHLGIFTMALSYWLFARGLQTVQVASAVTLSLAEPMTAALLGVLVVGERLPLAAWGGLLLILSGLMILAFPTRRYRAVREAV
ncbi:MAG: EamA family transporter [Desulfuromonas sp.]|nr:MAG: EamA family transporter [Desulfuromonas sp.]